ncbi:MAG: NADH-quinone oxidoreductase subunit NuoH [Methylocystaceae bacterium]
MENMWLNLATLLRDWLTVWGCSPALVNALLMLAKFIAIAGIVTVNVIVLVWLERKISGFIQMRLGPNRLGPFGTLQTVADALKLLSKEDIVPARTDRILFKLAPVFFMGVLLLLYAVLPFGNKDMVVWQSSIGLFYFLSIGSVTTVCLLAAGLGSNNKYSLLGAMRAVAQMVAYELPLTFSLLGVVMLVGSLSLSDILIAQDKYWLVLLQPLGFLIFMFAAAAELGRKPFDMPEGEQELTGGVYTEYTGMRWALFFLAEYTNLFAVCGLATTVFLGGGSGPFLPGWLWFFFKVYFLMWVFMWVGWTFPRIRIDRLMGFCWKVLIPLSLFNIFATGAGIYIFKGWGG